MSLREADRDAAALLDIVGAARRVAEFITGLDQSAFLKDHRTQDAVVRRLEIIGEAANRLTEPCRAASPAVPWSGLIGLRNVLAHQYDRVDYEIVWRVATETLPMVLSLLEPRLPSKPD